MNSIKLFLTISLICCKFCSLGQNQNNVWYFGNKAGLSFDISPPRALNDGVLSHTEGVSSVCDINGDLLFFTNGISVWNGLRSLMPNGSGLLGNNSSSQVLIVPKPDDCNIYYIFTTPSQTFLGTSTYSVVDMRLDNGKGDVSAKNIVLSELVSERISATLHSNGRDYWVVFQELVSNNFLSYYISPSGVNGVPVISSAGLINSTADDAVGCMKFSGDGKKLCTANELGIKKCQLFDFDNQTGIVSNGFTVSDTEGYGVEFSADDSKLYISSYLKFKLLQFDLSSNDANTIRNSAFVLADLSTIAKENGGALQLGPDNAIYVARNDRSFLGVIKMPNIAGMGAEFIDNAIGLNGKLCYAGLPNFIKNYTGQFCGSLKANFTRATLCTDAEITITVGATFGTAPYLYSINGTQFQTSNIFSNVPATNYTITVRDAASETRNITLNIPPIATLSVGTSDKVDSDCGLSNGSVTVLPVNGVAPFLYSRDGLNFERNNIFNNLPPSTIIFFIKDSVGCIASKPVTIEAKSNLKIFAGRDTGIFMNQSLGLFARDLTSSNFISYKWTPAEGLNNPFIRNPIAVISKNISYVVQASNAQGCIATDTIHIEVYKTVEILVPTAFTPNNDGLNDVLKPVPRGMKQLNYFRIYNRYGNPVYSSFKFGEGWDGRFKGELQNSGSFIWVAEGIDINGKIVFRKGVVTLLR